ncbi:MAG TPA: glycosyltransferase [Chloroflexia bacterium]|jgi:predicted glycosyltransferase
MQPNNPTSPTPGARPARVLMYCHDGFGLGHLRRTTTLAQNLRDAYPNSGILLAVGSASLPFWKDLPGLDYIKLPSIRKVATDCWSPRSLPISADMAHGIRASVLREVMLRYQPDLFVADYLPLGPAGELVPALKVAKAIGTRCVLGLRDILDSPETVARLWQQHGTAEAIEEWYDRVLVYGDPAVFDSVSAYEFPEKIAAMSRYCGYVVNDSPHEAPEKVRARLNLTTSRLVLVTGGGGQDAAPVVRSYLRGLREQVEARGDAPSFDSLVVLGPLMDRDTRNAVREEAQGLPVSIRTEVGDIRRYVAASDVVVTMGGYNSLMEVALARKPVVVVPRHGPSQEQKMRADLFASRGWVATAPDSETVTGGELLDIIERTLAEPPGAAWEGFRLDGAQRSVQALAECLADRHDERLAAVPDFVYGALPQGKLRNGYRTGRVPDLRSLYAEGAPTPNLQ